MDLCYVKLFNIDFLNILWFLIYIFVFNLCRFSKIV